MAYLTSVKKFQKLENMKTLTFTTPLHTFPMCTYMISDNFIMFRKEL